MGWPSLFVVGAPKAGTSSMWELLRRSPDVCMSVPKEPRYFNYVLNDVFMGGSVRSEREYLRLFERCDPALRMGEASPSYLSDVHAAAAIREASPAAAIVVMVRDPVERAYSHWYYYERRTALAERTFEQAVNESLRRWESQGLESGPYDPSHVVRLGMYASDILRYRQTFGPDDVHIVIYDEFCQSPAHVMQPLCASLGVRPPGNYELSASQRNRASGPRNAVARRLLSSSTLRTIARSLRLGKLAVVAGERLLLEPRDRPDLPVVIRRKLEAIYSEDTVALEELLGRPVPWGTSVSDG